MYGGGEMLKLNLVIMHAVRFIYIWLVSFYIIEYAFTIIYFPKPLHNSQLQYSPTSPSAPMTSHNPGLLTYPISPRANWLPTYTPSHWSDLSIWLVSFCIIENSFTIIYFGKPLHNSQLQYSPTSPSAPTTSHNPGLLGPVAKFRWSARLGMPWCFEITRRRRIVDYTPERQCMTCVTNFWILIISIHTSRFGNRIKQIWQPLLFINGYLCMEYTLF